MNKKKRFGYSYRKGTQEVRSKCTTGKPCQERSPVKKPLHKRVSGGLLLNVF